MNKIKTAWITAVIIALCAGVVPGCGQSGAASAQASAGQNTDAEDTTVAAAGVATTAATPETEPVDEFWEDDEEEWGFPEDL